MHNSTNTDRFIISRADGFNPSLVLSLTKEQREKARKKGTYEAALFGSLFNKMLPPDAKMSSWLPPVKKEDEFPLISPETNKLATLRQQIPNDPVATLDMPSVADDYYTHSVALLGKNAAVILGSVCYFVSDISLRSRVIKEIYTRKDSTFNLSCVEWLNPTTLAVGYQRSSDLYVIDITGRHMPKRQRALQHIALGQLTRITRLSNSVFLTGYKNGEVVYNDAETGESRSLLGMRRNPENVCSIAPSKNAKHVAVGYNDGSVSVYELTAQKTFTFVRTYISDISAGKRALAWFPGNKRLFICGGGKTDSVLRVFDTAHAEVMASHTLPFAITNIVFTDDRQFIATYANRIGHFILLNNKITPIKEVVTSSSKRLLDAVYSAQSGLITSSAGEFLNIWPPIVGKSPQQKSGEIKHEVIR